MRTKNIISKGQGYSRFIDNGYKAYLRKNHINK